MSRFPLLRISDFCITGSGSTPSRSAADRYYDGGTIPWVKSGELREGVIDATEECITEIALKECSVRLVPAGAILLAMYGATVGRLAILGIEATTNQAVCHIIPDAAVADVKYVYHALANQVPAIVGMGVGGAQPNISQGLVKSLVIPIPPLPEQRRIVAILEKADILRTKRREALARLDDLTQSIFLQMFGEPATNPFGWPVLPLEAIAVKVTDGEHQTPRRTQMGIKLLSARNVQDGFLDFGDVDYIDDVEYKRISKRCNPEIGDILISCSGSIGRVAPVETDEPLGLVRSAALVKPNREKLTSKFLEIYLRTPYLNRLMISNARTSSQANLFQGPIRALPVFLPPRSLQREFDAKMSVLQGIFAKQVQSKVALESLFDSLRHRAFRGELDWR